MKGEPSRLIPQKLTAKLELLMKGTFNERNTFCNLKSIPYFFDCKARFFSSFRAACIFCVISLPKGIDDAQSFLGYAVCRKNSLFTFYSLEHHMYILHMRDYAKQKADVVV